MAVHKVSEIGGKNGGVYSHTRDMSRMLVIEDMKKYE